jgi:hypothetical protein
LTANIIIARNAKALSNIKVHAFERTVKCVFKKTPIILGAILETLIMGISEQKPIN